MADTTPRRWLVEWTENVTHKDIAYVSDEDVRRELNIDDERWAEVDDITRATLTRHYLARRRDVEDFAGTRRWRTVRRGGMSVVTSVEWPQDEPEPAL